jgi:tetratricopeptide (TPR) repeat protein
VNRVEALALLQLEEKPSTEQVLANFNLRKIHLPDEVQTFEQARDILLIDNLRQDCLSIGKLLESCGLKLEIKILPRYIKTKIELESHKRSLVLSAIDAIKENAQLILKELESWDELKRHPKMGTALEYFHFDNHLPKLYQEIFIHSLNEHHISLEKVVDIKMSLMNYRNFIFENLRDYCLNIVEQFEQAQLYQSQEFQDFKDNINGCKTLQQINEMLLDLVELEFKHLDILKRDCEELERAIKGIHTPKPTHVFSPILHWYYYKLLLLQELKNQSIMQLFHLCRDFSKEEVSWTDFFNYVSYEIHNAKNKEQVLKLCQYFTEVTLEYHQIKDWLKMQSMTAELKNSLKAAFGIIPPNLRGITFQMIQKQKLNRNILIDTLLKETLEVSKTQLMKLAGIAPHSYIIHETQSLREISKIVVKMKF